LLQDLGLTQREALVYSVVARAGSLSVSDISRLLDIRREYVYRSLPPLLKNGLLQICIGSAMRLKAVPFNVAYSILLKKEQDRIDFIYKKIRFLQKQSVKSLQPLKESKDYFVLVEGKNAIIAKCTELINKAQNSIDLITSVQKLFFTTNVFNEDFREAAKRGVKTRIITYGYSEVTQIIKVQKELDTINKSIELRYLEKAPCQFCIYDKREVFMPVYLKTESFGTVPTLWSASPLLLAVYNKVFENFWEDSEKIKINNSRRQVKEEATLI